IGYGLGGFFSVALMITGATLFLGHGISPEHLGTIALGAQVPLGEIGLLLALVGILFAVGGASIDTVFSGAYNLAQFCGWEWGSGGTGADLEVAGGAGETARVTAILVGPGVWRQRSRWIGGIASFVGGGRRVRVPWEDVSEVESHVVLRKTAAELGFWRGDH